MVARPVVLGAAVVVAVAVPVVLVGTLALDDGSDLVFPLAVVVVAAFVAGGWFAGRNAERSKPAVGATAAFCGHAIAQAVNVALHVAEDDDIRPAFIAANAALAAACGLAGGALASR